MTEFTAAEPKVPGPAETVPLAGIRSIIARRMHESLQTMAQLTLHARASVGGSKEGFDRSTIRKPQGGYTAMVVYSAARTLVKHPKLNSTLEGSELKIWGSANVGVAVALEEGLIVPVIKQAQRLSIAEVGSALVELSDRARQGTLRASDVLGGTFTVTSLGRYRISGFTPIVNPPQVAILGIGRLDDRGLPLSLTIDHRAIDGEPAAHFLDDVVTMLESEFVQSD